MLLLLRFLHCGSCLLSGLCDPRGHRLCVIKLLIIWCWPERFLFLARGGLFLLNLIVRLYHVRHCSLHSLEGIAALWIGGLAVAAYWSLLFLGNSFGCACSSSLSVLQFIAFWAVHEDRVFERFIHPTFHVYSTHIHSTHVSILVVTQGFVLRELLLCPLLCLWSFIE